jgi:ribonuclease P protein component
MSPDSPSARSRSGERLERSETLRHTEHYRRCYASGRRKGGPLLLLYSFPNEIDRPRLGLTASAKVGGSVVRHRLKRWGREVFRRYAGRDRIAALDLVVHFKPGAATSSFSDFRRELERLLAALPSSGSSAAR